MIKCADTKLNTELLQTNFVVLKNVKACDVLMYPVNADLTNVYIDDDDVEVTWKRRSVEDLDKYKYFACKHKTRLVSLKQLY